MKIVNVPTVTAKEIKQELGIDACECEFAQDAKSDSYVILDLTEDHIDELREEIEWNKDHFEDKYIQRMLNELKLIDHFRKLGYDIEILVYGCW
jgi:DNA-directed RNA polymerase specialized sigma subunit